MRYLNDKSLGGGITWTLGCVYMVFRGISDGEPWLIAIGLLTGIPSAFITWCIFESDKKYHK